jgi:uncharacterized protein
MLETPAEILQALQPHVRFPSVLHGPPHWARVHRFGLALAERVDLPAEGRVCVELFAWLHDLAREDDGPGAQHAIDGAVQIDAVLPAIAGALSPAQIETVRAAIRYHSDGMVAGGAWDAGAFEGIDWPRDLLVATVGCCWDADRLDLPRVGIAPNDRYMSIAAWREVESLSARIHRRAAASIPVARSDYDPRLGARHRARATEGGAAQVEVLPSKRAHRGDA